MEKPLRALSSCSVPLTDITESKHCSTHSWTFGGQRLMFCKASSQLTTSAEALPHPAPSRNSTVTACTLGCCLKELLTDEEYLRGL